MTAQQRVLVIVAFLVLAVILHVMFWRWGPGNQVTLSFFTIQESTGYGSTKLVRWGLSPRVLLSSSDVFVANMLGIALPIILMFAAAFFYLKKPHSSASQGNQGVDN